MATQIFNLRISRKFDVPSIYHERIYYFPSDVIKTDLGIAIQIVNFIGGKWRQDTHYLKESKFILALESFAIKKGLITKGF